MTFTRAVFVFALAMLALGVIGSRYIAHALFAAAPGPRVLAVRLPAATPTSTPQPSPTTGKTAVPARPTRTPTPTPRPTRTPRPTPSPTPGTATLARYWVGTAIARPGNTIAIGYVIANDTGHTAHIALGASLKSSHALSWLAGGVNDPEHDVVAIVPPGISTHSRYFTLPPHLRAGYYDVAWGLRDPRTGQRIALVMASAAIRVRH